MARVLKPCGTPAAFARHKRHREEPCEACRAAWNEYYREWDRENRRIRARAKWAGTTRKGAAS